MVSNKYNPFRDAGETSFGQFTREIFSPAFAKGKMNLKALRVGAMRKYIKEFNKKKGIKLTGGSQVKKRDLVSTIKGLMADPDIDEMVGGSIWTDFVKEFSAKHSLKYACALSKYKEPLKKAYKLFKEKKDWYEPMKKEGSVGTTEPASTPAPAPSTAPAPTPAPAPAKKLPPIMSEREISLLNMKTADLKEILKGTKGLAKMKKEDLVSLILAKEGIASGVRWGDKPYLLQELKDAHRCNDPNDTFGGLHHLKKKLEGDYKRLEKLKAQPATTWKEKDDKHTDIYLIKDIISDVEKRISRCEGLLSRDLQAEYEGSGVISGGNRWTDFVKDFAKKNDTTYGCALSDIAIKPAYRLFKEGKEWWFPKTKEMETQTDDFVEPTPIPAPENIEPKVNVIEEKLEKLKQVGEAKGAVSYSPFSMITNVAFVNLLLKYGGKCIVADTTHMINIGISVNSVKSKTSILYYKLGETLRDCINRGVEIIAIPLFLMFGSSNGGHANMLIYRPFKRIVERYEPHGISYGNSTADDKSFNEQLKVIFEKNLTSYIGEVRYKPPIEICPSPKGFQSLESQLKGISGEGGGFCSMWSFFFTEMVFLNPEKSTKEIITEVLNLTKSEPAYLKSVIRGYVVEIEKSLDELLKRLGARGYSFKEKYEPMRTNKDALFAWLSRAIFDSGKYKQAPPQFEPLPDVEIQEKSDVDKLMQTYRDKLAGLKVNELQNIYFLYMLRTTAKKKDDIIDGIIKGLSSQNWAKMGATGLEDIDVILEDELYKGDNWKKVKRDYFIKKRDERKGK